MTGKPDNTAFFTRRRVLLALGGLAVAGGGATLLLMPPPAMAGKIVVHKDPSCQCCDQWARHMRQNGFTVSVNNVEDMAAIKSGAGIPEAMESCHTAFIDGYVIEGHVPAGDVKRVLDKRPAIKGLAVPGMPQSAPGMDSPEYEPFSVLAFDAKGVTGVFASY